MKSIVYVCRGMVAVCAIISFQGCGSGENGTNGSSRDPACHMPGTLCTWAGTGEAGFDGDGHALKESMMYWPMDLTFASNGRAYIMDWNNHAVRAVQDDGVAEDAIQGWFSAATGLTTIWRNQNAPQPPYPYAGLAIIAGPIKLGGKDEQRSSTALGQPPGQDVLVESVGLRTMTVSCRIYTAKEDVLDPARHARHLMSVAQSSLGRPSVIAAFSDAGLSIIEEGDVQNIDEVIEDAFLSRANMEVRFGLASNVSERTGFIEKVKASSTSLGFDDELFGVGA